MGNRFNYIEYYAQKAIEDEQRDALSKFDLSRLDIDENGIASNATRKVIAEALERLPLDNDMRYSMMRFEQAICEPNLEYSQVDFVVGLISRYKDLLLYAQLFHVQEHGKPNPEWGNIFMELPESDEDDDGSELESE